MSTLPLGVIGNESTTTTWAGIMNLGSERCSQARMSEGVDPAVVVVVTWAASRTWPSPPVAETTA